MLVRRSVEWMGYKIRMDRLCGQVVKVSGYKSRGPGFDSQPYQIFWEVGGLEWGPLSLVETTEGLLKWENSGSGLENQVYFTWRVCWSLNHNYGRLIFHLLFRFYVKNLFGIRMFSRRRTWYSHCDLEFRISLFRLKVSIYSLSVKVKVKVKISPLQAMDKAPTLLRQTTTRWRQGCQPYAPAALYPPGFFIFKDSWFLVLSSVRGWVYPRASAAGRIRSILKKSTSSGLEPATFRLAA
jgi:hypothetical protein